LTLQPVVVSKCGTRLLKGVPDAVERCDAYQGIFRCSPFYPQGVRPEWAARAAASAGEGSLRSPRRLRPAILQA